MAPTPYLEVRMNHRRTAGLAKVLFSDQDGNQYREIDLKGVGLSYFKGNRPSEPEYCFLSQITDENKSTSSPKGLANLPALIHEAKMAEKLIAVGVRTYRFLAIVELNELAVLIGPKLPPEIISIKEAKKRGIINPKRKPAVGIRAFVTKTRVQDLEGRDDLIDEARLLIAQRGQIMPPPQNNQDYLNWFSGSLGYQIKKLHEVGLVHRYISTHNITSDCCIVDLDSVTKGNDVIRDCFDAIRVLTSLANFCHCQNLTGRLTDEFMFSYEEG